MTRLAPFDMARLEAERQTPAALRRSLDDALGRRARNEPMWIFGYGSLMWNPGLDFDVRRVSTIYGYHRSFCLWSRINRGTPESPGLVLTLERGGSCRGLAYRLRRAVAAEQLFELWKREMSLGVVPAALARMPCGHRDFHGARVRREPRVHRIRGEASG